LDRVHEIRPRHGVRGPVKLAGGAENREARGARQERAHQTAIGLEPGSGLLGRRTAEFWRAHESAWDKTMPVSGLGDTIALLSIAVFARVGDRPLSAPRRA